MGLLEEIIENQKQLAEENAAIKTELLQIKKAKDPEQFVDINTIMIELHIKSRSDFNIKWQKRMPFLFRTGVGEAYRCKRSDLENFKSDLAAGKILFNKKIDKLCGGGF